jgi:hypothetical protein
MTDNGNREAMSEDESERQRADARSEHEQHREAMSEDESERQRADAPGERRPNSGRGFCPPRADLAPRLHVAS